MARSSSTPSGGGTLEDSPLDPKLSGNVDDPGRADILEGCGGGAETASGGAAATGFDECAEETAAVELSAIGDDASTILGEAARF
jgi:hypothetical protein